MIKVPRILKDIGIFQMATALLIIIFLVLTILGEGETASVRTFAFLLAAVSFCSLTLIIVKNRVLSFPPIVSLFFLLFLGWMLVSGFFSKDIAQTVWEILRTASYFALFLAVYNLTGKKKSSQTFLIGSLVTVGSVLLIKDLYNFFSWGGLSNGRYFVGTFYWHNQTAGFIVVLIPLLLSFFLATRNMFVKFILLSIIFLALVAIVFTYSRGGWLSLVASLILFSILYFKKIKSNVKPLVIMFGIFIIATFAILKPASIGKRAQSIKSELSSQTRTVSGNLRTTVWTNTFGIIKDNPIFGVGPGAFGALYYKYQNKPWLYAQHAHNQYLEYLAELGIVGFFLFAAIMSSAVFRIFAERKKLGDETRYPLLLGVIAGLFGSAVHALIDVDWSRISLYSIFWILLAVLFANLTKKGTKIEIVGIKKLIYLFPLVLLTASTFLITANGNYEMAQKNLKDNKILDAEANIVKAITLNPYDSTLYLPYGQIKEIQKKQSEAKEIYHKASSLSSYNSEPYYRLGRIEFVNKNYKQAKNYFLKAISLSPFSHPRLYMGLSNTYLKLGEIKQARQTLKTAVENGFPLNESFRGFEYLYDYTGFKKDLANTYFQLISLDMQLNEKEEAKKLINVVEKDLDPKNPAIPLLKTFVVK